MEFLFRILSQNRRIAGRNLYEDYTDIHCEYTVVSSPVKVAEKSMKVIAIIFYLFCAWNTVLSVQSNIFMGHNLVFSPER